MDWNGRESYAHDEKIYSLEPIVVLQKLSLEEVSAHVKGRSAQWGFPFAETLNTSKKDSNGAVNHFGKYEKGASTKKIKLSPVRHVLRVSRKHPNRYEKGELVQERPYQCSVCEEGFHTSILLAIHKRIHEKECAEEEFHDEDKLSTESSSGLETLASLTPSRSSLISLTDTESCSEDKRRYPSHPNVNLSGRSPNSSYVIRIDSVPTQPISNNCKGKNMNVPTKQHRCLECPVFFSSHWYLTLHMILLHFRNGNNSVRCPACHSNFETERHLRKHVSLIHSKHVKVMNLEISSSLGIPTSALTGERIQMSRNSEKDPQKRKNSSLNYSAKSSGHDKNLNKIQRMTQRGSHLELVEEELRRTILERFGMGDTFVITDVQRLALQISDSLHIMPFANSQPPKIWARRFLMGLESQFSRTALQTIKIDHVNAVYIKAITKLMSHGLTESNIFYACEGGLCCVDGNRKIKLLQKSSEEGKTLLVGDNISVVLSTNATGTVLSDPTLVLRGQIMNYKNPNDLDFTTPFYASKNFIDNDYFQEWFLYFVLSIPPTRPVLLLIEGHISQISYQTILIARSHNVHIAFVPSRKRFLHPHQLIRDVLLAPLRQSFERKASHFLNANRKSSFTLHEFNQIFKPSWEAAVQQLEISRSFLEAGFVPLSDVLHSASNASTDVLHSASNASTDVLHPASNASTPVVSVVKFENVSPSERDDSGQCAISNTPDKSLSGNSSTAKPPQTCYQCPLCEMNFSEEIELHKHVCVTNECDLFSCHLCGMSFALKDTLEFHLAKHGNTKGGMQESLSARKCLQKIQSKASDTSGKKNANVAEVVPHVPKNSKRVRIKTNSKILNSSPQDTSTSQSNSNGLFKKLEALFGLPCSYAGNLGSSSTSSASSLRSDTITASSSGSLADIDVLPWNYSEVEIKEELIDYVSPDQYQQSQLPPPPPLPDHDYLGQLYHP